MKHRLTTLPNGLRIVTADMADSYSVTASIAVGVGSRHEDYSVNGGVSHFLEHLLFKGTVKRPTTKIISEQIDAVGGFNNAYTSNELTNYYVKMPAGELPLALDILADMVSNSLLDAEEIDRERGVVIEEMNVYRDDPSSYVHRLTPQLLWPGHPLSRDVIGSEEVIRTIQRDTIAKYLTSHYNPQTMVVSVAGRVDHDEVVALVTKLMGGLVGGELPVAQPVGKLEASSDRTAILEKDTAQAHLTINALAYPYRHANDPAAKVISTILGRGLSSRLFINVRERKGLAYSINAGTENFTDSGDFGVYAGVNLEKTGDAIAAIVEELNDIRSKPVPADELQKAKSQLRGGMLMSQESNIAIADRLGTQLALLGSIRSVEETLADIDAVTSEDILRVADDMFAPHKLRMGIISPDPRDAVKTFESLTKE